MFAAITEGGNAVEKIKRSTAELIRAIYCFFVCSYISTEAAQSPLEKVPIITSTPSFSKFSLSTIPDPLFHQKYQSHEPRQQSMRNLNFILQVLPSHFNETYIPIHAKNSFRYYPSIFDTAIFVLIHKQASLKSEDIIVFKTSQILLPINFIPSMMLA